MIKLNLLTDKNGIHSCPLDEVPEVRFFASMLFGQVRGAVFLGVVKIFLSNMARTLIKMAQTRIIIHCRYNTKTT